MHPYRHERDSEVPRSGGSGVRYRRNTHFAHREAYIAETVLAVVLLTSLLASWMFPAWTRTLGIGAQVFALVGTLVGVFTMIIGVGPRTTPDYIYHVAIVAVLAWGIATARRQSLSAADDADRRHRTIHQTAG